MKITQVCIKWRKQDGSYRKYRAKEVLFYFSSCFTLFTLLSYFFQNLHLNSATLIFLNVESIIPVSFLQKSPLVLSKVFSFSFPAFSTYTKYLVAAAAKSLQSCPTLCDPIDGSPSGILKARISHPWQSHPWDSQGKNTGVGCHLLLQCMKGKSKK